MKRAFTLVELFVVMAMIAILTGAFVTSVASARRRALIARATQETKEMTNAILAYEQYAENRSLEGEKKDSWTPCAESSMAMILGKKKGASDEDIPVLYNGHVRGGMLLDPWGHPYEYRIVNTAELDGGGGQAAKSVDFKTAAALPNFFRLADGERK